MSEDAGTAAAARRARRRARREDGRWIRAFWGLIAVVAGTIGWLDHLGRIDARDYLEWWPLILIAIGLGHLLERKWVGALIWIAIGTAFLPAIPAMPYLRLRYLLAVWPLLISAAGVTLVVQALRPTVKDLPGRSAFHAFSFMGGSSRTAGSTHFYGGDAVVVMGGCQIDLSNARIEGEAVIDVLAFWGGIEIRIPRGCAVESRVTPLLGAFNDRTSDAAGAGAARVVIRGSAIMSGIEVKNAKEAA